MTAPLSETIARVEQQLALEPPVVSCVVLHRDDTLALLSCARRCEAMAEAGTSQTVAVLRGVAEYHQERERHGGAGRDFHAYAHTACLRAIDAAAERDTLAKRVGELEYVAGYQADLEAIRKTLDACDAPHDCEEGVSLEPTRIRLMAAEAGRLRAENERLRNELAKCERQQVDMLRGRNER